MSSASSNKNTITTETSDQDQWQLLANALPQLVWIADADGTVTYYNDRVFEYSGAKKNNNGSWDWGLLLHPEDQAITEQAWLTSVRTGQVYEVEHRAQMADGTYRWHLSRGYPQVNAEGRIIKWFGSATDIHNQILFKEELNRQVNERTAELRSLNEQLRNYNQELADFAFITSHDLQEPLRKIKLFSSMLMQKAGNKLDEKENAFLNKIYGSASKLTSSLHSLLHYSELSENESLVDVNLEKVVRDVISEQEFLIRQKNALVQVSELPTIKAAPEQMHELFYNLVNNALKFSKEDKQPVIHITGRVLPQDELPNDINEHRTYAEIVVRDNGIGFDPRFVSKIFTMFQRLHDITKYEGTGAGLVLCKKIVHRHNGRISAEGKSDEGATFKVLLPVE